MIKTVISALFLLLISIPSLNGQNALGNKYHFELEPLQFINSGWSIVGHYALNKRLQIGSNAFAQTLPKGSNDFAFNISGNIDLLAEQDFGMNLSVRYFLQDRDVQEGWVVSLPIGWETWTLTDEEANDAREYAFWYLSPRIGYLWYPFKRKQFYILGEVIGIIPISTDEDVQFGEVNVAINSFIPLPSIGLGIAF